MRNCCSSPWWLAGIVAVLALMVWRVFSVKPPESTGYEDQRGQQRREIAIAAAKADADRLNGYAAVDAAKGIYRVPLEAAQQLVLPELAQKKPAPSQVKVDPWLPMPPPSDPNATEPPPAALPSAPQGADTIRFEGAKPVEGTPAPAAPGETPPPAGAPAADAPAPAAGSPTTPPSNAPAPVPATAPPAPNRPPLIK